MSVCGFESSCSNLNFRFRACFEQGVSWHLGNYRVWIHSETRTWHHKNIQSNAPHRQVLTAQLSHLASLAKWLIVRLWAKWSWVRVQLQSRKLQILCLFWVSSPWHSGNYGVWIHSETRTWHDKKIQLKISVLVFNCPKTATQYHNQHKKSCIMKLPWCLGQGNNR